MVKGEGTILLVDDEEMIVEVSRELLEVLGYRVHVAKNGRDAVEIYKESVGRDQCGYSRYDYARYGRRGDIRRF